MAQLSIDQAMQTAMRHHQAGQLQQAEDIYRKILAQVPEHAPAVHGLGFIAHQVGRNDIAIDLIRRALAIEPNHAEAHYNLGIALQDSGQLDEAIAAYRRVVALRPDHAATYGNLGNALKDIGQLDEAVAAYRQAIALRPDDAQAYSNLGSALQEKGDVDGAIVTCRQAISLSPNLSEAHCNLGNALKDKGLLDEAIAACRQAIALRPNLTDAHVNLGNALKDKGLLDEAIAAYRQAIAVNPGFAEAQSNLGVALRDKGHLDAAIAACRRAVALRPVYAAAHYNLGICLVDDGQLDQAAAACRQAIALRPGYAEAHNNLGAALKEMGQVDKAVAAARQAIALRPSYAEAHSNLLLTLHYQEGHDPREIAAEHRRWDRQHAEAFERSVPSHANSRDPRRRLRIGYVSPDFRNHAVAPMVLPLLQCHDREHFEVFCYAQVRKPDAMTQRFRACSNYWRSTIGLSDEQMASQVRSDQIDILVDLAGHTADNRLLVFARKPAPVQVTRQGYPNTTGLTAIDYRMTDAFADPPGLNDTFHSEQLVRLPRTNWIYQPPENCPPPDHRPAREPVRFGCFNNFAKVTEPMLKAWAQILASVPDSTLLLKAKALALQDVQERVQRIFRAAGIARQRVDLMGWERSAADHLAIYNQIAIGLDPFPYHGTTTTCEALWMGVPVITLAGQTHVSRVGVSLLNNVGLAELVARDVEHYIKTAVELAQDRPRLDDLHSTLRQRMTKSPLMDAPGFARDIEAQYRRLWRAWCARDA